MTSFSRSANGFSHLILAVCIRVGSGAMLARAYMARWAAAAKRPTVPAQRWAPWTNTGLKALRLEVLRTDEIGDQNGNSGSMEFAPRPLPLEVHGLYRKI
jgi:hypothetical protein